MCTSIFVYSVFMSCIVGSQAYYVRVKVLGASDRIVGGCFSVGISHTYAVYLEYCILLLYIDMLTLV